MSRASRSSTPHGRHRGFGSTACGSRIQPDQVLGRVRRAGRRSGRARPCRRAAGRRGPARRSRPGSRGRRCRRTGSARARRARAGSAARSSGERRRRRRRDAGSAAGSRCASARERRGRRQRPAAPRCEEGDQRPRGRRPTAGSSQAGMPLILMPSLHHPVELARAEALRRVDQRAGQRLHAAADLALRDAGAAVADQALVAVAERAARERRRVVEARLRRCRRRGAGSSARPIELEQPSTSAGCAASVAEMS